MRGFMGEGEVESDQEEKARWKIMALKQSRETRRQRERAERLEEGMEQQREQIEQQREQMEELLRR